MQVTLTQTQETYVNARIDEGLYPSAGEMIGEALSLLAERERSPEARLARLRGDIAVGLAALGRGESVDGPAAFAELIAELTARAAAEPA